MTAVEHGLVSPVEDIPPAVRRCEWPYCDAWFDAADDGPHEHGWVAAVRGRVLLCPGHAKSGHLPWDFERTRGGTALLMWCTCCAVSGELEPTTFAVARAWWEGHVHG